MRTLSFRGWLSKALTAQVEASLSPSERQDQQRQALVDLVSAQHKLEGSWRDMIGYRDQFEVQARTALQLNATKSHQKCLREKARLDIAISDLEEHLAKIVDQRGQVEVLLFGQSVTPPWSPPRRASAVAEEEPVDGAFFAAVPIVTTRSRPSALAERLVLA